MTGNGAAEERERAQGRPAAAEEQPPAETEAQRAEHDAEEQVDQDQNQRRPQTPPPDLTATKRERDEYLELAQRTRADFDNYRKRVAKEASEAAQRGKADLARKLIPVLDNLERALGAAGVEPGDGGEDRKESTAGASLGRGVALVASELRSILADAGVEPYDPVGEVFDPSWHEALSTRAEQGAKPGTVVETLEKGYRLDGQVLRAARVVVSE